MTETKYIFPKQPQSMAVLAFIAVLIILLLVLIVMVHMRNRKLKSILEDSGMEVTCAVDGQEAVEIFEDCCFKKMHGR